MKPLFLPLLFFAIQAHAQTLEYSIWIGNKEIGQIEAIRAVHEDRKTYKIVSEASFRVIWKYHRTSDMMVVFLNDTLETSTSQVVMNDDLKEDSKYWKDGDAYKYHKQDKVEFHGSPILYSSSMLYFHEPTEVDSVYSETFLDNSFLEKISANQYKLYLPGNRENTYTYENGELMEILADRTIDLVFKRKSTSD